MPADDGTVTISDLAGDLVGNDQRWSIRIGSDTGPVLGLTNSSDFQCGVADGSVFDVTLDQLEAAVSGDIIEIVAVNETSIDNICGNDPGELSNTMTVTLEFPTLL